MILALKILFWFLLALVFYTYVGYGVLLWLLVRAKRRLNPDVAPVFFDEKDLPPLTFVVAAYNEKDWIAEKIKNCRSLKYPKDKLFFLFVTDGSDDGTPDIVSQHDDIQLFHRTERKGKIAAVNRIMPFVNTPITVFTDANTMLNENALLNIVKHYADPTTGVVAGEKRIRQSDADAANAAGEGIYWKYESKLKKWDSELYSVVGAAGELFSIRTELFEAIPEDTIIEDFYLTLGIAQKGYRIKYAPDAFATEGPSATVGEELKRKIRIAAGGLQAIARLKPLLNPFKHGWLSFQYISHRVLRWTLTPLALPLLFICNLMLAASGLLFFKWFLAVQLAFYALAFIGWLLEKKKIKLKAFFVPYYFCVMNYAVYRGFIRNLMGSQTVIWERAERG